ncbi:hypothetical protein WSM22_34910 [Cytophagales bacterium WSM2-2]|nr:hypothetical protein WSM22_34910 [Cytophagales bacterium WSM2-2]
MKSTRRIALLLSLVFLLPALFFSVYEISSLNKEEEMIQDIYDKQLEAILFSVNQYADDLLSGWMTKTEAAANEKQEVNGIPVKINELLSYNPSLATVFIYDTVNGKSVQQLYSLDSSVTSGSAIDYAIVKSREIAQQLISFKSSGFQKANVVPYQGKNLQELQCFIFIVENTPHHFRVAGLLVNPVLFIRDLVAPRLQNVAKDQFILSVIHKGTSSTIYSTMTSETHTIIENTAALTKDFWLFPDYSLGIESIGNSIQLIVKERTRTNLILLLSLDAILMVAVVLVFRNVKKEVQLAQNKADFVSNVSHEIRTPLALISMFAETLEMDRVKTEDKKREYYNIISKETQRLSGIVNKILNFSQTEANKKVLHPEFFESAEAIRGILTTYDFHLKNKCFEYTFDDRTSGQKIFADKEAFTEIIVNLLDNAIKYSTDRKKIEITALTEDGMGLVKVRDYGIGISREDQKHVFDKFYRVSTGDLAKARGTGLGLSLVKQLMDAQQGSVTVSSTLGEGTTFTLYFPLIKL